jgi:hypothetical protein
MDGTGEHLKSVRFRKTKITYFLLYMEDIVNTNTSIIIHINIERTCFQKWDCYRRLREEEKKNDRESIIIK